MSLYDNSQFRGVCPGDATAERQKSLSCERVGTLGTWFLADRLTQEWISGSGPQLLWAYGPAATGKTYISSLVVDHICSKDGRVGVVVYYFDDSHPQYNGADFGVAYPSLSRQLTAQVTDSPADAIDQAEGGRSTSLSLDGESPGFWNLIPSLFDSIFVVFDGVNASEAALKKMLVHFGVNNCQNSGVRILIISRYPPPRSLLRTYELPTIVMRAHEDDLMAYMVHEIGDVSAEKTPSSIPKDISGTMVNVIEMLDGAFPPLPQHRDISETLDELVQVLSNQSPSTKHKALSQLALAHVAKAEHGQNTFQVLYLVSALEELGYTPTISQVVDFLPFLGIHKTEDSYYTSDDIASMCAGLTTFSICIKAMRIQSSILQTHLREEASKNNTKGKMLRAAMSYLVQEDFQSGACSSSTSLKQRFQAHPFLPFAARILSVYTSRVPDREEALDAFLRFASHRGSIDSYLQAAGAWPYQDDDSYDELERSERRWTYFPRGYGPLHVAAHIVGGRVFIKALLQQGEDIEAKSKNGQTALHIAAGVEDESETARTLLEHGANVSAVDIGTETPLSIAVVEGGLETVKLLVEYGADVRSLDASVLEECAERRDIAEYLTGMSVDLPDVEEEGEEEDDYL
ncbi:hypothetical protein ABOM_003423 [Aspergillus bombycis]|uniref:Nephrocystin 3-like N-terminal domain-containing protein n=1 Tax=Aspergillus bombycis TaxID=109264 RepID=A0A1F8A9B3_9EURO|nr:hypothetical protein ABOM_003423 [Aspergillus bombycis]OGM48360.1 hypothetical protein ABOM_003423 [Aspergillus bombycis]